VCRKCHSETEQKEVRAHWGCRATDDDDDDDDDDDGDDDLVETTH
jgi:hypothetical protein